MLKSYLIIALLSMPTAFSATRNSFELDKKLAKTILKLNEKNSKKLNRHYYLKLLRLIDEIKSSKELIPPQFGKLNLKTKK